MKVTNVSKATVVVDGLVSIHGKPFRLAPAESFTLADGSWAPAAILRYKDQIEALVRAGDLRVKAPATTETAGLVARAKVTDSVEVKVHKPKHKTHPMLPPSGKEEPEEG